MQAEVAMVGEFQLDELATEKRWRGAHEGLPLDYSRFEVDESLSDVERCALFLGPNADKIQLLHAINSLPSLVSAVGRNLFRSLPLKRAASQADDECSIALAQSVQAILDESMLQKREVIEELLPIMLQQFNGRKRTEEVWTAWYDVLLVSAPRFDRQTAESALLTPALTQSVSSVKGGLAQRLRACRLLAPAAVALRGNDELLGSILEHVRTLCQDLQHTVRECMCAHVIVPLSRSLGPDKTAKNVMEDLLELIQDDHAAVRDAALEALTTLLGTLPTAARTACMPTLRTILKRPTDLAPATVQLLASQMATLPLCLRPLSPSDAVLLHTCYAHLACKGTPSVRLHCARAFPAMLTAPDATGHPQLTPGPLLESYTRFVADVDLNLERLQESVRKSAAAQLHQLAMMIPPDGGLQHLVKPLLTLLCDSSPAVLLSVLSNLPIVLSRVSFDASHYRDIINALVAIEDDSKRQWRMAVAIANALQAMADVVPSATIYEILLPLLFRMLEHGSRVVLAPASNAMCAMFRRLTRERHRTEILIRIIRDFAHSSSHVHRLAFVRLALPAIMPDVKRTVRLPEGVTALEKVNAATSALLTDTDRRVCNEARSMHAAFKAVPVRLTGVGVLGIHGASAKPEDIEYEAADKRLEEGEADFTINTDDLHRACHSNGQILAKGGSVEHASAIRTRRRGAGGAAGHDTDDTASVAGGRLQGRQRHDGSHALRGTSDSKTHSASTSKGSTKLIARKSSGRLT